jgi:hypothetical protein
MNGHELAIGMALGRIKQEGGRHTEILLGIQSRLASLLEKMADRLSDRLTDRLAASPTVSSAASGASGALAWTRALTDLAKALSPYSLILAAALAKRYWPEALPALKDLIKAAVS